MEERRQGEGEEKHTHPNNVGKRTLKGKRSGSKRGRGEETIYNEGKKIVAKKEGDRGGGEEEDGSNTTNEAKDNKREKERETRSRRFGKIVGNITFESTILLSRIIC